MSHPKVMQMPSGLNIQTWAAAQGWSSRSGQITRVSKWHVFKHRKKKITFRIEESEYFPKICCYSHMQIHYLSSIIWLWVEYWNILQQSSSEMKTNEKGSIGKKIFIFKICIFQQLYNVSNILLLQITVHCFMEAIFYSPLCRSNCTEYH